MLSFFPQNVLDGILDLIGSVSEGFPTYFLSLENAEQKDEYEYCTILCYVHVIAIPWYVRLCEIFNES